MTWLSPKKYTEMRIIITSLALLLVGLLSAQQVEKPTKGDVLLDNATLVTVTNGTITGDLLIRDGKIADIGNSITPDAKTTVIDCQGKFVYPGFIDGNTHLGLGEIGAVSVTQDYNELGSFIPHMQALTAVNPSSVNIPVTRVEGVTSALTVPSGGRFPGTAALINLHGYTPEQMNAGFKAVVMNFPSSGKRGRWDRRSEEDIKKDAEKATKEIDDVWKKAKLYHTIDSTSRAQGKKRNDYNPQMDALMPVFRGEASMIISVNKKNDILTAIKWVEKNKVNAIFMSVSEGWRAADEIAKAGIPCIVGPIMRYPSRDSDRYDAPYTNAGVLSKAGVKVCIGTNETENVRNLPYNAGFAATYGMGTEEALKAVTINPAEIFGLGKELGSLEKGKIANLFVSDGDPFETKTNILQLFINGWSIPLESRHTLLYNEFLKRDPGLSK